MNFPRIYGVVLAGGQSRRMGTDKARLRLYGQSLLARSVALLEASGCTTVVVSGQPGLYPEFPCIADAYPDLGPVGGMVSVLNAMVEIPEGAAVVVMPVDVPWLSASILRKLLSTAVGHGGCMVADNPLPLVLLKTAALDARCADAEAALSHGQAWSVRRFIEPLALQTCVPDKAMAQALFNVNSPSAWQVVQTETASKI